MKKSTKIVIGVFISIGLLIVLTVGGCYLMLPTEEDYNAMWKDAMKQANEEGWEGAQEIYDKATKDAQKKREEELRKEYPNRAIERYTP